MQKHLKIFASFLIVSAIFYYFVSCTPYMTDNFVFSKDIHPCYAQFYNGAPITADPMTIHAAFRQAVEMYFTWCGRFMGNLTVYLLFLLPHWLYCITAAICFGFYIWLLQMCVFGRAWRENLTPGWIFGLAAMLWVSIPSFGEAFFWLSVGGQIALLGQALVFLPLRFALDKMIAPGNRLRLFILCFCAILGGTMVSSLDYPTSAAMPVTAAACAIFLYFRQKKPDRKLPVVALCLTIGLAIGSFLTLTAPGNSQRMLLSNDPNLKEYAAMSWADRILSWLSDLPVAALMQYVPLILLLWGLWRLWRIYGRSWPKHLPIAALLFLLPALLTHGAYLFTAWPPPRAFVTSCVQLIICAVIILVAVLQSGNTTTQKQFRFLKILLCVFCIGTLFYESFEFYSLHKFIAKREATIATNTSGNVITPSLNGKGNRYRVLGFYLSDLTDDPDFWVNRAMAAYYGLHSISQQKEIGRFVLPQDKIDVTIQKRKIEASHEGEPLSSLHFYYYGAPGIISRMPYEIGMLIYNWLGNSKPGDWRRWLIPVLLARSDVTLKPDGEGYKGMSPPIRFTSIDRLWLVKPGESKYSFDLLPMERIDQDN